MSEKHSTAKMTTIFAMPPEGGVEVPMVCPCCGTSLGIRQVFDDTEKTGFTNTFITCRSCEFRADLRVDEEKISITWGGGER